MEFQQTSQLTKQERRELRRQEKEMDWRQTARNRLIRRVVFWIFVVLAVSGGIFGMVKFASRPPSETGPAIAVDAVSAEDWVKGSRDAKIVLIEYSDFQCPACAFYYPVLKKLSEEFGNKIIIAYRHFPLPQHQNAKPAAYAAEAAGRQGKFWGMHDLIFDNQKEWKDKRSADEVFVNYAQTLNLNMDQFKTDFTLKETRKKVESAYQNGIRLGLNSTPTFFLNGKKIPNPRNYESFRDVILQIINENP